MNAAQSQRELRTIQRQGERYKEYKIQRIQASFDMDRNTAAETLEWIELKFANQTFAAACGLVAGFYVHRKLTPILQARSLLFKKPWMVPMVPLVAYYCIYTGAKQLRGRRFQGLEVNFNKMSGSNDIISRFRDVDDRKDAGNDSDHLQNYIATCAANSREQLEEDLKNLVPVRESKYRNKRIKRADRDADDIYWTFGRIHGLENIANIPDNILLSPDMSPEKLQELCAQAKPNGVQFHTFDDLVSNAMRGLSKYKEVVNNMSLSRSDRTKLLALPFRMAKQNQGPAPKRGMWQWDLFTELAGGKDWDHYRDLQYDDEEKITIYNYEKHLPASYLERVDTDSEEFKKEIKMMTLTSKTAYEAHSELKKNYRNLMNILSFLSEEEGKAFIHAIKSKERNDILDQIHGGKLEAMLAEISEKDNYLSRNPYRLKRHKMYYNDAEKTPIEKKKIKDLFKFSREFKERFDREIGLEDTLPRYFEDHKRRIQSLYRHTMEPVIALREEMGLDMAHRFETAFYRYRDLKEVKESWNEDMMLDHSYYYFLNSYFIHMNMLDYEIDYTGPGEYVKDEADMEELAAMNNANPHSPYNRNAFEVNKLEELEDYEPKFNFYLSGFDEENNPIGGEEDDDDEEGEGEEEEVHNMPFRELDLEENVEPVDWENEMYPLSKVHPDTEYLDLDESVRDKYDNIELESFMKFLDLKPFFAWEDNAGYHNRLGLHTLEDWAQISDPEYYMLGEVERETFEKGIFRVHRSGSTVRQRHPAQKPHFGPTVDE
jgi:hypothetical protein